MAQVSGADVAAGFESEGIERAGAAARRLVTRGLVTRRLVARRTAAPEPSRRWAWIAGGAALLAGLLVTGCGGPATPGGGAQAGPAARTPGAAGAAAGAAAPGRAAGPGAVPAPGAAGDAGTGPATAPGEMGSGSGETGSETGDGNAGSASSGESDGAEPAPPSGLPSSAPLRVRLASACVRPGDTQRMEVETLPEAYLAYDNLYPDNRDGRVHGGIDGQARSDRAGRFTATWVVAPGTPLGRVRVDVGVSAPGGSAITMRYYRLAASC